MALDSSRISSILYGSVVAVLKTAVVDCIQYREVLYNLLSRDLKIKYKRTWFGYFWSLLNPILQLAVLAAVFSHIVRLGMKDYRSRQVVSEAGEVKLTRAYYYCEGCGQGVFPPG